MSKKITSIILALCMLMSCAVVSNFAVNAVTTDKSSTAASESSYTSSAGTGAQNKIQGSAVLHCFNWSYNTIKQNLQSIKDAGYTAVQTSPVQPPKDYNSSWNDQNGQWWKLYQPISIKIADGNTWLGSKADLKSLCSTAESMGIKVIVDIVANHMANVSDQKGNSMDNISPQVDAELKNNSAYWHINNWTGYDDSNRQTMTQGFIGEPDLNTANSHIQELYKNLLIDCINQGVDGFRFDAAKHIELPTDGSFGSKFWPTVIDGSKASTNNDIYYYGEILNGCATDISNYTNYMSVTDNYSSDSILKSANEGNASGMANSNYSKGAGANKTVLWAESHDTYMGNSGSAGLSNTKNVSNSTIIKAWAIVGSRANATSLFFARPATTMGSASTDTTWKSKAVAEVNKFKNYFDGQSENIASNGSIVYNERGTTGVVLVNASGSSTSVNVPANKMAAGTYKDAITGSTFKVANGKISGQIGDTGVAVVYNEKAPGPSASITPGSTTYQTDTLTLTLKFENATGGQYSIDGGSYTSYTNGQTIKIGSGVAYGTTTTVSVIASDGKTTSDPVSYTYTKVDPSATQKVYFDNSSYGWSNVYCYIYLDESTHNADWPGQQMKYDSATGYYVLEVPANLSKGYAMFTESKDATTNRYPADGEQGMQLNGNSMLMKANHEWVEFIAPQPTTAKPTVQPTTAKPTAAPTTTDIKDKILIGDVNIDKTISIIDATNIQLHLVEMSTLTGNSLIAADVDKDGYISVRDATAIQCYLVELTDQSYYCGQYVGGDQPTTAKPTVQPTTVKPTVQSTTAKPTVQPTTAKPTVQPTTVKPTEQPTTVKPTPSTYTVKFSNSQHWSGKIYCYYWSEGQEGPNKWPGVEMTFLEKNGYNEDVYTVQVPNTANYVIFNNNSSQTVNIPLDGSALAFYAKPDLDEKNHNKYGTWELQ